MSHLKQIATDVRRNLAENLDWCFAEGDDEEVARLCIAASPLMRWLM